MQTFARSKSGNGRNSGRRSERRSLVPAALQLLGQGLTPTAPDTEQLSPANANFHRYLAILKTSPLDLRLYEQP